jgi:hypothetical protein
MEKPIILTYYFCNILLLNDLAKNILIINLKSHTFQSKEMTKVNETGSGKILIYDTESSKGASDI